MNDPIARQSDIDDLLAALVSLNSTVAELATLTGRLLALQLRGIDFEARRQPPAQPVRFTENGQDVGTERIMMSVHHAQRLLADLIERRQR